MLPEDDLVFTVPLPWQANHDNAPAKAQDNTTLLWMMMRVKYYWRRRHFGLGEIMPHPLSTWVPPILQRKEVRHTLKRSCLILTALFVLSYCVAWLVQSDSPATPHLVETAAEDTVFPTGSPVTTMPPTVEPGEREDGLTYCKTLHDIDVAEGVNGTCGTYDLSEGVVCWRYRIFMRAPIVTRQRGPWSIDHVVFPHNCQDQKVPVLTWSEVDVMYRDIHDHIHKFTGLRLESCLQALIHAVNAPDQATLCAPKYSPGDLLAFREPEA